MNVPKRRICEFVLEQYEDHRIRTVAVAAAGGLVLLGLLTNLLGWLLGG